MKQSYTPITSTQCRAIPSRLPSAMKRGRAVGKVVVGQGSRVGNVGHNSIGTFGVPVHSLPPATVARAGDGDGGGMMGAISIGADVEAGNVGHCSHGHHVSHPPPPPTASVPPTSALNNVANAPPSSAQPLPSPSAAIGLTSLSASSSSSPSSSSSSSAAGPLSLPAQALPHIMFSYSWAYKEAAHQIAREVKSRGYRVWIDHGNMGSELARSLGEGKPALASCLCPTPGFAFTVDG